MSAVLLPLPPGEGRGEGRQRVEEPSAKFLALLERPLVRSFDLLVGSPGGVAKLRVLILTLAVRGKLVPQDSNDEPVSALLRKIRAEKDRLIAKGEIKQDKPLSPIAQEERPFELPQGWAWVRMGDLANTSEAGWSPTCLGTPRRPGAWGVLKVSAVSWGAFDAHANKELPANLSPRPEYEVRDSDFLLSRANTEELVARSVVVDKAEPRLMLSDKIIRLDVSRHMNRAFLNFCNNAGHSRTHYVANASGTSSSMKNVAREVVLNTPVPLPPLAEQSRIVARVEELMRLCDALEAKGRLEAAQHSQLVSTLLGALTATNSAVALADNWQRVAAHFDLLLDRPEAVDALEQTILQLAVRGLLVPQDPADEPASVLLKKIREGKDRLINKSPIKRDEPLPPNGDAGKPFGLPQGWEWARFPELGEFGRGKSKHRPRNDPALFNPPAHPLIQTGEVARAKRVIQEYHSKYSEFGLAQSKLWPTGTLCITIAANIADAALLGFDACFPDSVVGFVPAPAIGDAAYFLAFMETAKTRLIAFAPATAQKNINLEVLGSLLIPLPPLAEMQRIVARVESLRRLCADLRQCLSAGQTTQAHLANAMVASAA